MKTVTATKKVQKAFLETVRDYRMLAPGDRVLCGLSGGADSVVLLHLLLSLKQEYSLRILAVHVHHGIRGAEADRDEAFCRQLCREYGVRLYCEHADVPGYAAESGRNLEDAARCLRYEVFRRLRAEADIDRIALAHHADDNMETVLLNLTRGSGLAGICGIPPVRGEIIRPLIACKKSDIAGYCAENGLSYVTDSTNADPSYARNFIRSHVIPLLAELNPEVQQAFYQTSAIARADDEALWLESETHTLSEGRRKLSALPDAVLDRVLLREYRCILEKCKTGFDPVRPECAGSRADIPDGGSTPGKMLQAHAEDGGETTSDTVRPECAGSRANIPDGGSTPGKMLQVPPANNDGCDGLMQVRLKVASPEAAFTEHPTPFAPGKTVSSDCASANALPAPAQTVLLQDARFPALTGKQAAALRRIIRSDCVHACFSLPGRITLVCDRDTAAFSAQTAEKPGFIPYRLQNGANPSPDGRSVLFVTEADSFIPEALPEEIKAFKNIYKFFIHTKINPDKIRGTITVRTRCGGDTYRIRNQTKSVKKLFQSLKLPASRVSGLPILCDDDGILWIPGFPPRDGCAAKDGKALLLYYLT